MERLPGDALSVILSEFSLLEAVRTSIVCRSWVNLWKFIPCLNFDASKVSWRYTSYIREAWYVEWVNRVTRSVADAAYHVRELRVHYWLGERYKDDIKKWMQFAVNKQVETIDINLGGYGSMDPHFWRHDQECKLPEEECCHALSGLVYLFHLKSLSLTYVNVNKRFIEHVLCRCLLLQYVSLVHPGNVADLNVRSDGLRYLKIIDFGVEFLTEMQAPNLETFVYVGRVFQPRTVNLPKLVSISISVDDRFRFLSILRPFKTQLSFLQYLSLRLNEEALLKRKHIPKFLYVEILSIQFGIVIRNCGRTFILLVNACPSLKKLQIQFEWYHPKKHPQELALKGGLKCHRLEYLKELELTVKREEFYWDFVGNVIANSPHLEKVYINLRAIRHLRLNLVKDNAMSLQRLLPMGAKLIFITRDGMDLLRHLFEPEL